MSYNLNEPSTFINIKLTDVGRRQLSLGKLAFSSYVLSDREINYGIDRTDKYSILTNRILSPVDKHPTISLSLDGTQPVALEEKFIASARQFSTAATASVGFFTGSTGIWSADTAKQLGYIDISTNTVGGTTAWSPTGSTRITYTGTTWSPSIGDLLWVPWQTPANSAATINQNNILLSANPINALWYRITSADTGNNTIYVDRPTPNFWGNSEFGTGNTTVTRAMYYPWNGVEDYYGSAATQDVSVWNMNIIRTQSVPGTNISISGYTSYGSLEYNGTKHYLGFSAETPSFGVVHFTNEFTGNTYAEQFIEKTFQMNIPYVMWWNAAEDNGEGMAHGLTLYDKNGDTIKDALAGTTYRYLKDGISSTSRIVGRVYHKLQIIAITDQELLSTLSYKENRNYTLPPLDVSLVANPKSPLTTSNATGLCNSGYTYFVTYASENNTGYTSGVTYGFGESAPCRYIQKIEGEVDVDGNPQFLSCKFPSSPFPYLRGSANMSPDSVYSGTGWNSNKIQLLVNEQLSTLNYEASNVPSNAWKLLSSGSTGNGLYTGDSADASIHPNKLAGFNFVASQEDYDSGVTYTLGTMHSGVTTDFRTTSGLTYGNEAFFFGNVKTDILATTYKTLITVPAPNDSFNTTDNLSFDDVLDTDTYITEIGVLDSDSNVVAVGKTTYPIRKNNGRYLVFQLEMDF